MMLMLLYCSSFLLCVSFSELINPFKSTAAFLKLKPKSTNVFLTSHDSTKSQDVISINDKESKFIRGFLRRSFQILSLKFGLNILPVLNNEESVSQVLAFDKVDFKNNLPSLKITLFQGKVYVWKEFISNKAIELLRSNIDELLADSNNSFSTSGLSNKALNIPADKQFDKSRDRMVCPISFTSDDNKTHSGLEVGGELQKKISSLQKDLSILLNRPTLQEEEMYYSVSLPGSSLKLHLDERHEELKGRRGWQSKTRRSLSWLVYLSDGEWDIERQGGQLRCFPQSRTVVPNYRLNERDVAFQSVGAHAGNLQVAWFVLPNSMNQSECVQPVFMDCWRQENGYVALYLAGADPVSGEKDSDRLYITRDFSLTDSLTGEREDDWEQFLLPIARSASGSNSLLKIEEPALWARGEPPAGSTTIDITPSRGTLVIFDSVTFCVISLCYKYRN